MVSHQYMARNIPEWTKEICERQPLKSFTWSILEHFVPYDELKQNWRMSLAESNLKLLNYESIKLKD